VGGLQLLGHVCIYGARSASMWAGLHLWGVRSVFGGGGQVFLFKDRVSGQIPAMNCRGFKAGTLLEVTVDWD